MEGINRGDQSSGERKRVKRETKEGKVQNKRRAEKVKQIKGIKKRKR